jgi:hypothetical protein
MILSRRAAGINNLLKYDLPAAYRVAAITKATTRSTTLRLRYSRLTELARKNHRRRLTLWLSTIRNVVDHYSVMNPDPRSHRCKIHFHNIGDTRHLRPSRRLKYLCVGFPGQVRNSTSLTKLAKPECLLRIYLPRRRINILRIPLRIVTPIPGSLIVSLCRLDVIAENGERHNHAQAQDRKQAPTHQQLTPEAEADDE